VVTQAGRQENKGLHEKSYLYNDQTHTFPVARNVPESNDDQCWGPVMRGEKGGKSNPSVRFLVT
jgi:hypothetical protein